MGIFNKTKESNQEESRVETQHVDKQKNTTKLAIGIVDEAMNPKSKDNNDTLDIGQHAMALSEFIKNTGTPMTVGIQGEWGSGKTSLLNQIRCELEENGEDVTHKQIWINAWEHSLMAKPEEALMNIVNEIIQEMLDSDSKLKENEVIKAAVNKFFTGALRIGASVVAGSTGDNIAKELIDGKGSTIKELKVQLKKLAEAIKSEGTNDHERIIIYVDDLDRIEPKYAVQILELLKNIFSIPNCVFILAIDYDVVVKGLESKFGKKTEKNEREFRAFFDKIIQLPFMMPTGQYNIGSYVGKLLEDIKFFGDNNISKSEENKLNTIVTKSIGGNPRSLKRLVNSLSLIQIFSSLSGKNSNEEKNKNEQLLLLAIVCLQIQYPDLYYLLSENPNFLEWDDKFAFKNTKGKEVIDKIKFETDLKNAKELEAFDEPWEVAMYRICYIKPEYHARVENISIFFNFMRHELLNNDQEAVGATISTILEKTAVTNVRSIASGQTLVQQEMVYKYGLYFYNIGVDDGSSNRHREDYVTYNFITSGQALRFKRYMENFKVGDIFVAYKSGKDRGYVGIGRITHKAKPINDVKINDTYLLDLPDLKSTTLDGISKDKDGLDYGEYVALVEWIRPIEGNKSKFKPKSGLFTPISTVAKMNKHIKTIKYLEKEFDVNFEELME